MSESAFSKTQVTGQVISNDFQPKRRRLHKLQQCPINIIATIRRYINTYISTFSRIKAKKITVLYCNHKTIMRSMDLNSIHTFMTQSRYFYTEPGHFLYVHCHNFVAFSKFFFFESFVTARK